MLLSAMGFSIMSVLVKRLGTSVPHMELVFFRSAVNFVIVLVSMALLGESYFPPRPGLLFFRGLMGFCGVTCLFYGISHLPLSIASMINWSSPLFVILFSRIFLKERIGARSAWWVAVAFVGLVFLVRPDTGSGSGSLPMMGVGIAVAGAAFGGMAYVAVRAATARVGVNAIVLYFTGTATILSLPFAIPVFRIPDASALVQLLGVGAFAAWGQFCMTQGYRHAAAGLVSTMGLFNAVFSMLWGWWFFSEALAPVQWMGMTLLAAGVALATRASRR